MRISRETAIKILIVVGVILMLVGGYFSIQLDLYSNTIVEKDKNELLLYIFAALAAVDIIAMTFLMLKK